MSGKSRISSYVICTTPRSGSTLLCTLLKATGIAGNPDSHFHSTSLDGWLQAYGVRTTEPSAQQAVRTVVNAAIEIGTGDTGVFGLRIQRASFDHFIQQIGGLHPQADCDLDRIQASFGSTRFIHLTRSNKMEQAISLVKATQTGLWHRAADGSELERLSAPKPPVYDPQQIEKTLLELIEMERAWEGWFMQEGLSPMRISYDELSANPADTLAKCLNFLGLASQYGEDILPPTAKLADALSQEWAERFRAEYPAYFQN
ncbi:Stf0 family sulfotransferase [Aliisedimentitalea scapharcae]|uniref:Stf0 family sulfotransferase n=1 Tax=Aliisedimentitalea scapharcae TaxID=1524259 RepID=A0ABZ2XX97_9RHOB